jgi:tetratricopeptide (TPR) repeat protein
MPGSLTTAGSSPDRARLDALWDFRDPAASERRFREFLRQSKPPIVPAVRIEALTQLARAQTLRRRFAGAGRTLERARSLLPAGDPRARVRYWLEYGRLLNSSGHPRSARGPFEAAWSAARRAGEDGLAVDAAHMVAIAATGDDCRRWNLRALALAERSRDPTARRWRASLLNNLGWTAYDADDFAGALGLFRRVVRARRSMGDASEVRVAQWCVAKTLRRMGRVSDALRRQRGLLAAHRRARTVDGYVYEELAECLLALDRTAEARPYFRRAYAELGQDPWLRASEPTRLERLRALGGLPTRRRA